MLGGIERKLTSLLGDGLAARTDLAVIEAPGSAQPLAAAKGQLIVSVAELNLQEAFDPGFISNVSVGGNPASRRILPLGFRARLDFRRKPVGNTDTQRSNARSLLLDDVALAAHLLSAQDVRSGKAFVNGAGDPGFRVLFFQLAKVALDPDISDRGLTANVEFQGAAEIWPPSAPQPEGQIKSVESLVATQPVDVKAVREHLSQDESTQVRIRSLPATTKTRGPLQLAVRVVSDLPLNQRGTIPTGSDGAETGLKIVPVTAPETAIQYNAPAGELGVTRVEYVAVHIATPDKKRGVFLGSAAIHLLPRTE